MTAALQPLTPGAAQIQQTIQKLKQIERWVGTRSLEWGPGIRMLIYSVITGRHSFLLGEPGVAKSRVITDLVGCFEGYDKFATQIHPEMPVRDLVGAFDVPEFVQNGRVTYNVEHSLVMDCGIAHLGEIWLGNGGTLTGLLGILNEGRIRLGDTVHETGVVVVGDSNEMPDTVNVADGDVKRKTLVAVADRFLLRDRVRPHVRSFQNQKAMARMPVDKAGPTSSPTSVSRVEIASLTDAIYQMVTTPAGFPDEAVMEFWHFIGACRKNGIRISDRRAMWAREVLAASAILAGRDQIQVQDLATARWWAWLTPSHIPTVMQILEDTVEVAHPVLLREQAACGRVYQDLMDLTQTRIPDPSDPNKRKTIAWLDSRNPDRVTKGNEVAQQLTDSITVLENLMARFPDEGDEIRAAIDELTAWNYQIQCEVLQIGGLSKEDLWR